MNIVKNSKLKVMLKRVVDMYKVKSDALNMSYLLNGKDYGVPVVDVY